jgi:hypothetical protein
MKMRIALAATLAALALPAYSADAPQAPRAPEPPESGFSFNFDLGDILADAEGAKRQVEIYTQEHAGAISKWAESFASEMHGSMATLFADRVGRGKLVKGAPYSAEAVTETNQPLADGNVISHKRTSRVYRDGEGRTRQETLRGDAVRAVYIHDPVASMSYTLLPQNKLAIGVQRRAQRVRIDKDQVSVDDGEMKSEHRVIVRRGEKDGDPGSRQEVTVHVVRLGDGDMKELDMPMAPTPPRAPGAAPTPPMPPMPPIPGVQTMRFEHFGLGKGTTTSLGTKTFDGVKAEGKQVVWTIPAGQVGNRAPINVTSETWYSPELQVTVYTRYNDPRTGESIYRLAAIKRAEPSADLFKVPADYKVRGKVKEKDKEKEKDKG